MVPTTAPMVCYVVNTRTSQFTVQAFANGLAAAVAHSPKIAIRDWTGEAKFNPVTLNDASIKVRIKAASLEVLDELRDADRRELHRVMNQEVLETARFSDMVFESSEVKFEKQKDDLYKANVRGSLTLHGQTNDHAFSAQVAIGVDSARAYGDFTMLQTDYGIRIASIAGGTLKLRDELKVSFLYSGSKASLNGVRAQFTEVLVCTT